MSPGDAIPDLDTRSLQNIMKLGGKKKLDTMIDILKDSGPVRLQDLKDAKTLSAAKSAAQGLKTTAGNAGLARLEDFCDQIVNANTWAPGSSLLKQAEAAFERGRKALLDYRGGL